MDTKRLMSKMTGIIVTKSPEEAFWILFKILRIAGLFPIDGRMKVVPSLAFRSALFLAVLTGTTLYFIYADDRIMIMYGLTHRYLYRFRKISETATYSIILYQLCANRDKLLLIVDNLKTIESFLAPSDEKWVWCLHPIQYMGTICFSILLFVLERSVFPLDLKIAIHWFSMQIDLILAATFVNQYSAFLNLIKYSLNRVMASRCYHLYPKLYSLICDTCETLNDVYGLLIFQLVVVYFIGLLHQFYQLFGVTDKPPMVSFSIVCCAAYYGTLLLEIIYSGNAISLETNKFNRTFYKNIVECKSIEISEELLFHFERTKEFLFSANGFFNVNNSILCSMILTGTTYLVILVQYSAGALIW